jgi:hypothetical protein
MEALKEDPGLMDSDCLLNYSGQGLNLTKHWRRMKYHPKLRVRTKLVFLVMNIIVIVLNIIIIIII